MFNFNEKYQSSIKKDDENYLGSDEATLTEVADKNGFKLYEIECPYEEDFGVDYDDIKGVFPEFEVDKSKSYVIKQGDTIYY